MLLMDCTHVVFECSCMIGGVDKGVFSSRQVKSTAVQAGVKCAISHVHCVVRQVECMICNIQCLIDCLVLSSNICCLVGCLVKCVFQGVIISCRIDNICGSYYSCEVFTFGRQHGRRSVAYFIHSRTSLTYVCHVVVNCTIRTNGAFAPLVNKVWRRRRTYPDQLGIYAYRRITCVDHQS